MKHIKNQQSLSGPLYAPLFCHFQKGTGFLTITLLVSTQIGTCKIHPSISLFKM